MASPLAGACTVHYDPSNMLALVRLRGAANGSIIAQCALAVHSHEKWEDHFDVIWFEDNITYLEVTVEQLDRMVEAQTMQETGRDLIVTARTDYKIVMALYAARVRGEGRPARVCNTLEEALGAVGLSELPDALRPDRGADYVSHWQVRPGSEGK